MKNIPVEELGGRYGSAFIAALRQTMGLPLESASEVRVWGVGKAKDHLSEMLNRVRDGQCQVVRRRSEDPVVMMSVTQLADFIELAAPKRRFADLIAHDPSLPVAGPLTISEESFGHEDVQLELGVAVPSTGDAVVIVGADDKGLFTPAAAPWSRLSGE